MPRPFQLDFKVHAAEFDMRSNAGGVADSVVTTMQNVHYDKQLRAFICRTGFQFNNSGNLLSGSLHYGRGLTWNPGAPSGQQVAMKDGALYKWTNLTFPATLVGTVGASPTTRPSVVSFRGPSSDVIYIADGGPLNKYDNTTLTLNIASTPSVTTLAVYNNRLYGISGLDQTLYWSGLSNGDTLGISPNGGSAIVRTFKNDPIIGLLPLGSSLFLIHTDSISRFTGWSQDDFNISDGTRGVSPFIGVQLALGALCVGGQHAYVVSTHGVWQFSESGESIKISDPVWLSANTGGAPISPSLAILGITSTDSGHGALVVTSREEIWFWLGGEIWLWSWALERWVGRYEVQPFYGTANHIVSMWIDPNAPPGGSPFPFIYALTTNGHVLSIPAPSILGGSTLLDDGSQAISYALKWYAPRFASGTTAARDLFLKIGQIEAGTVTVATVDARDVVTNSTNITFPFGDTRLFPQWVRLGLGGNATDLTIGMSSTTTGAGKGQWALYQAGLSGFLYPARPALSGAAFD